MYVQPGDSAATFALEPYRRLLANTLAWVASARRPPMGRRAPHAAAHGVITRLRFPGPRLAPEQETPPKRRYADQAVAQRTVSPR